MSTRALTLANAIAAIERRGVLLVYPLQNRPRPRSLWSELLPKTEMRWAWDEDADQRVVQLWHLREQLARSKRVVYTKWFRNRATFFSRDVFRAMLASFRSTGAILRGLPRESIELLEALEENSPQGTKSLRAAAQLSGKMLESTYTKAMNRLWARLLVVGAGESEEGGFPSLSMGATRLLFEELWDEAATPHPEHDEALTKLFADAPELRKAFERVQATLVAG